MTRLCPRATVLATSREIMRIEGESVYRVPALDVPAPGQAAPDIILDHSAVELFVTRAKALDAGFSPQPEDLASIVEICRHLDGIPLAIEFAAARAAFVGTEQVAAGLRDRFALLTSGRRTAIPRHRTLRAALDWSYQLLSKEEQRLLRHLAVFPAGFTFEAAQAVGGIGRAGQSIVEDLSSLVSKSLCERVNSDIANAMASVGDDTRLCVGRSSPRMASIRAPRGAMPSISAISSLPWRPAREAG